MTYGLPLWYRLHGTGVHALLLPLKKVQRAALLWASGAFSTTPGGALEYLTGSPPVRIYCDVLLQRHGSRLATLDANHALRLLQRTPELPVHAFARARHRLIRTRAPDNPVPAIMAIANGITEPFLTVHDENRRGSRLLDLYQDRITFWHFDHPPKSQTELFAAWRGDFDLRVDAWRQDPHTYIIATDGSLRGASAYSGFVSTSTSAVRAVPATSSYAAEAQALELAARHLVDSAHMGHTVFLVDNAAAARSIFQADVCDGQHIAIRFCTFLRLWLQSSPLNRLSVSWCPSHAGIPENEAADALVAAADAPMPPALHTRVAAQKRFRLTAGQHWRLAWLSQKTRGANLTRLNGNGRPLAPCLGSQRHRFVMKCDDSPTLFSRFVRFVTGHMPSAEYRRRFFPDAPIHCRLCPGHHPATRSHIICECRFFAPPFTSFPAFLRRDRNYVGLIAFLKDHPRAASFDALVPFARRPTRRRPYRALFPD